MPSPPTLLQILVAGPCRSFAGDDPDLVAAHMRLMMDTDLRLFRAGHRPVTAEMLALPLIGAAAFERVGDAVFDEVLRRIGAVPGCAS